MGRLTYGIAVVALLAHPVLGGQQPPDRSHPSGIARWLVRVSITGGLAGSRREVSINGDGRLQANGSGIFGNVSCTVQPGTPVVQKIEAALEGSHLDTWQPRYVSKTNPDGCCDQFQYAVHVEQENDHGLRSARETYWFDVSAALVPPAISALFNSVYEARHACVF